MLIHCCILLDFLCELYYDARIHEHQVYELFPLHWVQKLPLSTPFSDILGLPSSNEVTEDIHIHTNYQNITILYVLNFDG
jgi:hypothetical protein